MSEPTRVDFLVYYRKQLQIICDKIDREIKKQEERKEKRDDESMVNQKDLTDPEFLRNYVNHPGLIEALETCRDYLKSICEKERSDDGRLFYYSTNYGGRVAMLAMSTKFLHLYIAPRIGVYDNIPPEAWHELRFGKSQGDRWDKFQLTSKYQAEKAISFLRPFFVLSEKKERGEEKVNINATTNQAENL